MRAFLLQIWLSFHSFHVPKRHTCCYPPPAPALTRTTCVVVPVLTHLTVQLSWNKQLVACTYYSCEFALAVVKVCITKRRSTPHQDCHLAHFLWTQWHPIWNAFSMNSTEDRIGNGILMQSALPYRRKNRMFWGLVGWYKRPFPEILSPTLAWHDMTSVV